MPVYKQDLTNLAETLENAPRRVAIDTETMLDMVANEVMSYQLAHVPVKTGNLKGTINIQKRPGWRKVGPDHNQAPYDIYVELGTAPHIIKAKPGRVLAFQVGGQTVFARSVHHPGTPATYFVRDSLRQWQASLAEKMAKTGVEAITRGK